jgi:hypothetical protein
LVVEADLDPPGMHLVALYVDDQVLASMIQRVKTRPSTKIRLSTNRLSTNLLLIL